MIDYYKENFQFYIILFGWLAVGMFGGPLIYVLLPLSVMLMKQKGMYEELFIGFFFILILSDSEIPHLVFAKNIKIVYLLLLALFVAFDSGEFTPFNTSYRTFIPFFIVAFICLCFSPTFFVSFQKTFSYCIMFFLVPNFITKLHRDFGTKSLKNIIYFGTSMLLLGFFLFVVDKGYAYNSIIGRYNGVFGNPNGLGLYAFLLFTLFFILNDIYVNLFSRQEKIFIYSVIIASIIFSNSRNAFISVAILIVFDRFFKKSLYLGIIASVVIIVGNIMISEQIPILIKQFGLESFFRLNTLTELSGRAVAWQFAWAKIQNNYFIGRGFGYDEFTMRANYHMLSKLGTQGGVHSSYLSLWLNFGLVGALIYMRSFFLVFIKALQISNLSFSIMYAVLFSAAFEGLFIGSLNPQMIILLMVMTIIGDESFNYSETHTSEPELTLA